jgi:hypothetical protein
MGTHWEQTETNLLPPLPPTPARKNQKKRKVNSPEHEISFGCMKFLFPKELVTIFNLD